MYNFSANQTRARSPDSWVEVPSRSSTASLSSAADEPARYHTIRRNGSNLRERGRIHNSSPLHIELLQRTPSVGGSSQEECEESESESDRVMTSSNEGIHSSPSEPDSQKSKEEEEHEEEDETATALGVVTDTNCFTPQPNAFSHPPSSSRQRSSAPGSYFPATSRPSVSTHRRFSSSQQDRPSHCPYNAISPHHHPDHDAALRASLTTLLSLGAAARGLPKAKQSTPRQPAPTSSARVDPTTIRTLDESAALGLERPTLQPRRISSTPSSSNRAISPAVESFAAQQQAQQSQSKRKAVRSSSKDRERERQRLVKKPRRLLIEEGVSPTLLTWVVSAGVLVLVSALSFSAGYKVGQENARFEAMSAGAGGGGCGRTAGKSGMGLRRLRWGSAAQAVTA